MKVSELIKLLSEMPQDYDVRYAAEGQFIHNEADAVAIQKNSDGDYVVIFDKEFGH